MNIGRSSLKIFAANALSTILSFIALAFFTRELTTHQMGIFFLFQASLNALTIPSDLGINSGLVKRLSEGNSHNEVISSALLIKSILLLLLVMAILLTKPLINEYLGANLAIFLVVALVLQEFSKVMIDILKGERRVGETALPNLSKSFTFSIVGVILVYLGFGVIGLIYALFSGMVVLLAWGLYRSRIGFARPSITQIRSIIDYSKYAAISSFGGFLYNWLDVIVIGYFLTQSDVGVYEISWRITAVVLLLSKAIATTIFPEVSKLDAENASIKIENLITQAITPSLILVIPSFVGTILFSEEILGLVFGPEYTAAGLVLIILMADQVTESVQVIIGRSLGAVDRPDLAAKATLIGLVTNLVLNIVLVWKFGILGAAVATMASSLLTDYLHGFYLSQFISIRFPWGEIRWCVLSSVGMAIVLLITRRLFTIESLPALLGTVTVGAVTYFVFVLLSSSIREKVISHVTGQ